MEKLFLIIILSLIFIILLYPFLFKFIVLKIFKIYGLRVEFKKLGFFHPFRFYAENLIINYFKSENYDTFSFQCEKIFFLVRFLPLLWGKIKIKKIYIKNPYLFYENKMNSFLKIQLLPSPNRVFFENIIIFQGKIKFIDYVLPGPYQLLMEGINLYGAQMDLSFPVSILFFIKRGKARLGRGKIKSRNHYIKKKPLRGNLIFHKIKWMDVMGITIPLMEITFDMEIEFEHLKNQTNVSGKIFILNNIEKKNGGIGFSFPIIWSQYRLPMDLGIQKLIEKIFETIQPSLIEKGLILIGKEFFDKFRKTPYEFE